ncbi:P-loop containing nucleoside triphosphate hydrolase protein [Syncephalis pseudoplumigaleata]|uniref:ATP-dependent RNA helicase n=1 Tax=Syncephalis pseudoplumigaleata TaxID=1712513 RepID=A0A4P9Z626_9FUNG|nr:P-loop containing nucleoside triphosphate hydrolase protein [Syncephalis pseudoplumigaleata]|eukprot:RKP27985.1 P-loop containing nucleoside triphosphate hydrolase protein [Syncephalis pseudoplumigaleata]
MPKTSKKRRHTEAQASEVEVETTTTVETTSGPEIEKRRVHTAVLNAAHAAWKASESIRVSTTQSDDDDGDDAVDSMSVDEVPAVEVDGLLALGDPLKQAAGHEASATDKPTSMLGIPPWLARPTTITADTTWPVDDARLGLSTALVQRCRQAHIEQLFAVQTAVIPRLLRYRDWNGHYVDGDLCVSAPTGSGKTLAYVLPMVETLKKRVVTRLRALVVLPTRDLVLQVKETFEEFCRSTTLKIGMATGQTSFAQEQRQIVGDPEQGLSGVDILIATPGRLMDHLNGTRHFTLQHLRFLVIDEADRLLDQSFQAWLPRLLDTLAAVHGATKTMAGLPGPPRSRTQKLLFSATLTRNPEKIASLRLVNPSYIAVQASLDQGAERYMTPTTLKEHYLVCRSTEKPLMVIHFVRAFALTGTLCFTKSIDAAHRLARLLELYQQHATSEAADTETSVRLAAEYSSDLSASERASVMRQFRQGKIRILICSDLVARGIDLDCVQSVISYDVPIYMKKYIHRVGRTARAGREGAAFTLVEEQEARSFKEMMRKAGHWEQVRRVNVKPSELEPLIPHYEASLEALQVMVQPHRARTQKAADVEKEAATTTADESMTAMPASEEAPKPSREPPRRRQLLGADVLCQHLRQQMSQPATMTL